MSDPMKLPNSDIVALNRCPACKGAKVDVEVLFLVEKGSDEAKAHPGAHAFAEGHCPDCNKTFGNFVDWDALRVYEEWQVAQTRRMANEALDAIEAAQEAEIAAFAKALETDFILPVDFLNE